MTAKSEFPNSVAFTFGDNEALCQTLLALVRSGKKRATCEGLRTFEQEGEPLPKVGRQDIALNWDGTPALAIETESVELVRFCDVNESFALAEGENDSLLGWQQGHQRYFERNGGFDPQMILVCERFLLVKDFG